MISVPRLSSRAEMPMTAIMIAAESPTTTILRWVVRSAVYSDEFMPAPEHFERQRNIVFWDTALIPTYKTPPVRLAPPKADIRPQRSLMSALCQRRRRLIHFDLVRPEYSAETCPCSFFASSW